MGGGDARNEALFSYVSCEARVPKDHPSALAIAERTGDSGEQVLTAIVLGYEAAGRIDEAITPGFRARGFHGCLVAIFATAVAAGRLLQLDPMVWHYDYSNQFCLNDRRNLCRPNQYLTFL